MYEKPYPDHWDVKEVKIKCEYCGKDAVELQITCCCGDFWTVQKCKNCNK